LVLLAYEKPIMWRGNRNKNEAAAKG